MSIISNVVPIGLFGYLCIPHDSFVGTELIIASHTRWRTRELPPIDLIYTSMFSFPSLPFILSLNVPLSHYGASVRVFSQPFGLHSQLLL